MFCKDCGSGNIKEDFSDGSSVCTNCGLVVERFLLDTRPIQRDIHSEIMYSDTDILTNKTIKPFLERFEIPKHIGMDAESTYNKFCNSISNRKKHLLCGACIHTSLNKFKFTRVSKTDICSFFNVKWCELIKINHMIEGTSNCSRIGCDYQKLCNLISNVYERNKVVQKYIAIKDKIVKHRNFINMRHDKVLLSYLTYILIQTDSTIKESDCFPIIGIVPSTYHKYVKLFRHSQII